MIQESWSRIEIVDSFDIRNRSCYGPRLGGKSVDIIGLGSISLRVSKDWKFLGCIINREVMLALGKDGFTINMGHGALIYEKELMKCLIEGEIEGATILDAMASKGITSNFVTCTTVISYYGKVGWEDDGLDLFYKMKELDCVFNVCAYNVVLGMLGKKLRLEEMLDVLLDMRSNSCVPNWITWNTMFAICSNRGMEKYASKVFVK